MIAAFDYIGHVDDAHHDFHDVLDDDTVLAHAASDHASAAASNAHVRRRSVNSSPTLGHRSSSGGSNSSGASQPLAEQLVGDDVAPPIAASTNANRKHDDDVEAGAAAALDSEQRAKLRRMGLLTALAIGLHNCPEGLVSFLGALADSRIGIGLAIAIAVHNIPEGTSVAVPIFYATGSRWKGVGWATLSGVSEPVGALLGYAFLGAVSGEIAYAILFGIVSGMMVVHFFFCFILLVLNMK